MTDFGSALPEIVVPPPGPESRRLAEELREFESPNVTYLGSRFPVFWEEARGSNVKDVDGNVYVDLTAAFAVAAAGHAHPEIVEAVRCQADRLLHGMGDVHPPEIKARLLRRLAEVAPGSLKKTILASSGAEAVEAALKTVALATGRPRVVSFGGGYHGMTFGALAVSGREDFRRHFEMQLPDTRVLLPYPDPRSSREGPGAVARESLAEVERRLDGPGGELIGAILAEPIQGRGGDVVPPDGWLAGLRSICDRRGLLLVLDEIYTGFGRTGRWFACDHAEVVPDILVVGKALTGGLPFAACVGTDEVMAAWPVSTGEAIHTSTFLGHPLGCAAALKSLEIIEREGLPERAATEGHRAMERLRAGLNGNPRIAEIRGRGLMIGIEMVSPGDPERPDPDAVFEVMAGGLSRGYLFLGGGVRSNVISLSPPLNIPRPLLDAAVDTIIDIVTDLD